MVYLHQNKTQTIILKFITMQTRNIYTSDLNFSNNIATVVFEENNFNINFAIILKDDGLYLENVASTDESLQARIKKYEGLVGDSEALDKRLTYIQYHTRKTIAAIAEKGSEDELPTQTKTETEMETPKFTTEERKDAKLGAKADQPKVGLEAQIFEYVRESLESEESAETVNYFIKKTLDELGVVPGKIEHIVNDVKTGVTKNMGTQHKQFGEILMALKAGVNLALVGPAGSGKTTAVSQAAEALGLKFYSKSVSAQTGVHEFFGYQDANGNYVRTLFREAYENGGVFLLDEFDAGNPNVLASMNQATANGHCAFADGMVTKHEDFIVVMAGNTFGHGATSEYVGRNKIDAATLDRFAFIYFEYDQDFEMELAPNKEWCKEIQEIRARVQAKKVKAIVSPRATFDGAKLLAAGLKKSQVLQMVVYKGLTQDEINLIKA